MTHKSNYSDKQIWKIITDNKRLAYYIANRFVGSSKVKYFMSYYWETLYNGIKNDGLEKGNMGTVFHFAALRAYKTFRLKEIPTVFVPYYMADIINKPDSKKAILEGKSIETVNGYTVDNFSATVAMKAFERTVQHDDVAPDSISRPDFEMIHAIETSPISEYFGAPLDHFLLRLANRLKLGNYDRWQDSKVVVQTLYCLARYYEIELRVALMDESVFGLNTDFDLVTAFMARSNRDYEDPKSKTTLQIIADDIGVSRERVRQMIDKSISILQGVKRPGHSF